LKDLASTDDYEDIFGELWSDERWVCWKQKAGSKKPITPWYYARRSAYASTSDPKTWAKGIRAWREAYGGDLALNGIGYVFSDSGPLVGIDLDKCRDPKTGDVQAWAREVIDRLDSYTEISPSGDGFHIYVKSDRPLSDLSDDHPDGKLEAYSTRRFFTTTLNRDGLRLGDDEINESPDGLGWLIDRYQTEKSVKKVSSLSASHDVDARWEPDSWIPDALEHLDPDMGYESWVAVGMAIHHEYGGSDEGFKLWDAWSSDGQKYNGSEMRSKWQSFDGGSGYTGASIYHKAKLEGWDGYSGIEHSEEDKKNLERLISKEVGSDSSKPDEDKQQSEEDGEDSGESEQKFGMSWHSYGDALRDDTNYDPYLIEPGIIGPQDIYLMFSPPKTGKSMALLDQSAHWAAGRSWLDMRPQRPLKIAMMNFELKYDSIRRRAEYLNHRQTFDEEEMSRLDNNLLITERFTPRFDGYNEMILDCYKSIQGVQPDTDWDLLLVDPIVNAFMGETENSNREMMEFLDALQTCAYALNPDCALGLVHHTNKTPRDEMKKNPFNALRGAGALRGAYDTGIALFHESQKREKLRMVFEFRNSEGIPDKTLKMEDGEFKRVDESSGGSSDGLTKDEQYQKICRLIDQRIRKHGEVHTARSFSKRFADMAGLPSAKTIRRRISDLVSKQVIGFFDASQYGAPEPNPRSNGHLKTFETVIYYSVGDKYGEVTPVCQSEADESKNITGGMIEVGGTVVEMEHPSAPDSLIPVGRITG